MSDEEMVAVNLGNDYYQGACFSTDFGVKDYLVPRSQLERWKAVRVAYEAMQAEIDQVMTEQVERIREINAARPKSPMAEFLERVYERQTTFALSVSPLLRGPNYKEPE